MALDPKRKSACKAAILDHLDHVGPREWNAVRDAFADVPKATFWRLVRTTRAEVLIDKVQAIPAGDEAAQDAAVDEAFSTDYSNLASDLKNSLREPPRLRDLCGRDAIDPQAVLAACIANANAVVDHARAADGKVRQPKLLLAASKVMADVLRTAAAVSTVLWDERRVRDFYKAMMEEIAAESPAVAARIAARLEDLNARSGLASSIGR